MGLRRLLFNFYINLCQKSENSSKTSSFFQLKYLNIGVIIKKLPSIQKKGSFELKKKCFWRYDLGLLIPLCTTVKCKALPFSTKNLFLFAFWIIFFAQNSDIPAIVNFVFCLGGLWRNRHRLQITEQCNGVSSLSVDFQAFFGWFVSQDRRKSEM